MSEPDPPPELRSDELLTAFELHRVQFLIVGGFAAQLHGATRQTKDVDVCPAWGPANFERLAGALEDLDAELRLAPELGDVHVPASPELLLQTSVTHWRTRAGDVDVVIAIPAGERGKPLGYRELSQRAVTVHVGGVTAIVAALEDIVRSKEVADRDKDREALPELYALLAAQNEVTERLGVDAATRCAREPPAKRGPDPPSPSGHQRRGREPRLGR